MCIRYERKSPLADTLDALAAFLIVAGALLLLAQFVDVVALWPILLCFGVALGLSGLARSIRKHRPYYCIIDRR